MAVLHFEGTVTKFKNVTTCTAWRADGRLLMTGEAGGTCAVIETATRKAMQMQSGPRDPGCRKLMEASSRFVLLQHLLLRCGIVVITALLYVWVLRKNQTLKQVPAHKDNSIPTRMQLADAMPQL
eukprot:1171752-Amphidinium_carterae.1